MSKPVQQSPRLMQNVFVLLLLAMFACLSTFLVMMGAQVYRASVERSDGSNDARIVAAVVRSSIWAQDGGTVRIEDHDGIPALAIEDDFDGDIYVKRLFCYDGYLWESYTSAEREFEADSGESLCEMRSFEPTLAGSMLSIRLTETDGDESEIRIRLRAGGADE